MIPSASFPSSSSSSSASATVHVEKATSEFLIGPDWTLNINICDTINSNPGLAKDVVKAVKKRLQHKNPRVQLLALTLLETMVKNCGDYVHFQIVERNILQEMIKIVKKKIDMHVRDKILVLLNSWQEAFGGPGGKHPQYYWAYEELRRSGVQFPRSSPEAASIFTPPVTHPPPRHVQPGYGMPSNSSQRLDEAMASEMENLSLSSINSMRDVLELLSDMLQAVNPNDRLAVKDEVIVDLVEQCRANQKRLMQMLTTTGDEELLGQGLELNDSLQSVLGKHDAIASGSPLPTQVTNFRPHSTEVHNSVLKPTEVRESSPAPRAIPSAPIVAETRHQVEEDDDDDFAQLARRHSKTQSTTTPNTYIGASDGGTSPNPSSGTSSSMSAGSTSPSNTLALALPDPPAPVKTTKEQDMIDFLSITLSTTATSPPRTPPTPTAPTSQGYPYASQTYPTNQGHVPSTSQTYPTNQGHVPSNSYVVPWAQPEPRFQPQPQLQPRPRPQNQPNPQFSSGYPPPPWAATPGYYSNPSSVTPYTYSTPRANAMASYTPLQGVRPLQHLNSFPARGINNGSAINGDPHVGPTPTGVAPAVGPKPFVPSYRLFEDLNVLGSADGRFKTSNASPPSLSGASGQSMVGGRK